MVIYFIYYNIILQKQKVNKSINYEMKKIKIKTNNNAIAV